MIFCLKAPSFDFSLFMTFPLKALLP
jgi:hypothetical protein